MPPAPRRTPEPSSEQARAIDDLIAALEQAALGSPPPTLARLLGHLERLKAAAWERLLRETAEDVARRTASDPLDDVRHLTPLQVAELLSLKEAYIHELCRSGRLPATKQGKYWIIPVAGLRQWLAYRNGDVDSTATLRLQSLNPRGDAAPTARPGRLLPQRRPPTPG